MTLTSHCDKLFLETRGSIRHAARFRALCTTGGHMLRFSLLQVLVLCFLMGGVFLVPMSPGATLKPVVMGKRGVVAAGNPLVAEAGFRMMQKGGNAVDAGVASVFAAAVVEQMSFGMGG